MSVSHQRFSWYRIVWNLLWIPPLFLLRFLFALLVMVQHLKVSAFLKAWRAVR